jgi:hypothetical protein
MELKLDLAFPFALVGFYFKDSVDLAFRLGIRRLSVWHSTFIFKTLYVHLIECFFQTGIISGGVFSLGLRFYTR